MRILITILFFLTLPFALFGQRELDSLLKSANQGFTDRKYALYRDGFIGALKYRHNQPTYLYHAARGCALTGQDERSLGYLKRLASCGFVASPESDTLFRRVVALPEYAEVGTRFSRNSDPTGEAQKYRSVNANGIILESVCETPDGRLIVSSVRYGRLYELTASGDTLSFGPPLLGGAFGVHMLRDGQMGVVANYPGEIPTLNDTTTHQYFHILDAHTGTLRASYELTKNLPGQSLLGDWLELPNGEILFSDSKVPRLVHLNLKTSAVTIFANKPEWRNLQGLVLMPDGKRLLIADYSVGIWQMDMTTKECFLMQSPDDVCVLGIDGLYTSKDRLIATQNGVKPNRVIELSLSLNQTEITGWRTLLANHPDMNDPALGQALPDGTFIFVASSQWSTAKVATNDPKLLRMETPVILQINFTP